MRKAKNNNLKKVGVYRKRGYGDGLVGNLMTSQAEDLCVSIGVKAEYDSSCLSPSTGQRN